MTEMNKIFLPILAAMMMLSSCADFSLSGPAYEIVFEPVSDVMTKGSSAGPISGTTFPDNRTVLLSAYYTAQSGDTGSGNYFTDIPFTKYGDPSVWRGGTYTQQNPKYWPSRGTMNFIALSKENNASGTSLAGTVDHPGSNTAASLRYSMPDNSSIQDDVMFAYKGAQACSSHDNVALNFQHAQAQIAVTAACAVNTGNFGVSIRGMYLRKAQYSGRVTATPANNSSVSFSWDNLGSQTASVAFGTTSGAGTRLTTSQSSYGKGIMVPAQSPSGAASGIDIYIEYTMHNGYKADGTTADNILMTYVYTVPAMTWASSNRYVFSFTFSMNEISVSASVSSDWGNGGSTAVNVG